MIRGLLRLAYLGSSRKSINHTKKSVLVIYLRPDLEFHIQHHDVPQYFTQLTSQQRPQHQIYLSFEQYPLKSLNLPENSQKSTQKSHIQTKLAKNSTKEEQDRFQVKLDFEEVKNLLKWKYQTHKQLTLIKTDTKLLALTSKITSQQPKTSIQKPMKNNLIQITLETKQQKTKASIDIQNFQTLKTILQKSFPSIVSIQNFYENSLQQMINNYEQIQKRQKSSKIQILQIYGNQFQEDDEQNKDFIL